MSDALLVLLRINLAVGAAVILVLALRLPVRRLFGARIAYGLWALAPLAALAMLAPARVVTVAAPAAAQMSGPAMVMETGAAVASAPVGPDLWALAGGLWIAGGLASLAWLAWRQAEFGRAARLGLAGPAAVGLLRPTVVTPFDFARRYTAREQLVVLAHEATHIQRCDTRINAAVALARCVNWFNPAIHVLAHHLRIDQELACDAQVVAAHPTARRSYAEAMLKTQLAARPLPLGCYWPAQSTHPLAERIRLLSRHTPSRGRRSLGHAVVTLLGVTAVWSAWAARPAQLVQVPVATPAWAAAAPVVVVAGATLPAPPVQASARTTAEQRPAILQAASVEATDTAAQAPAVEPQADTPPPWAHITRIRMLAEQSAVARGSAVRVLAVMTDPEGHRLTTDLTAFGSQQAFRTGWFERNGSRQALFTSVVQDGERLLVSASLNRRFDPDVSGAAVFRAGQTGQITLANGQVVTITPTIRAETPEELAEGQRASRNMPWAFDSSAWRSRCRGDEACRPASTPAPAET